MRVSLSSLALFVLLAGCTDNGAEGGPDFSLSASPSSLSLVQGESVSATVAIDRMNGFDAPVAVTVTGLPAGVTADPLTIPAGADSGALVLHATAIAVQGGPLPLEVSGEADDEIRVSSLSLLVRGHAGTLDQTFGGGDGWLIEDFANLNDRANVVIPGPGGTVLVGGGATAVSQLDFAICRYLADGTLDSTFGSGTGRVTIDMGGDDFIIALELQADGKILAAGISAGHFAVARFNADGTLDLSFGSGTGKFFRPIGSSSEARTIEIQASGKIVVTGVAYTSSWDVALLRLDTSGELDSDFGVAGVRVFDFAGTQDYPYGSALVANDAIIVAAGSNSDYGFVRFDANGMLDTSFGPGPAPKGWHVNVLAGADNVQALHVNPDGTMLLAGTTDADFAVARFLADGKIDASFGGGMGRRVIDFGAGSTDTLGQMAVLDDGSIVLAGWTLAADQDIAFVRLTAGGEPDLSFGTTGTGRVTVDLGAGNDYARGIAVDADGSLLVTGAAATNGQLDDLLLLRFWP